MTIECTDRYLFGLVALGTREVRTGVTETLESVEWIGGLKIGREVTVLDSDTVRVRHFAGPLLGRNVVRATGEINNYDAHPKGHHGALHSIPTTFFGKLVGHRRVYRWV